ncbi:MAG: hypothetical protein WDN47_03905 [Candidatus Doudnabacteria bacterium]
MDNIKVKVVEHGGKGVVWGIGWLFTIGFMHLMFWQGVLAVIIWPYYLGEAIRTLVH